MGLGGKYSYIVQIQCRTDNATLKPSVLSPVDSTFRPNYTDLEIRWIDKLLNYLFLFNSDKNINIMENNIIIIIIILLTI